VSTSVNKLIALLQQVDIEFTPTDLADVLWLVNFSKLNRLITLLQQVDIEFTPTDLADVLWLARFITEPSLLTDSKKNTPETPIDANPILDKETDNQESTLNSTEQIDSIANKLKLYPNSTTGNSGKAGNASAIHVPRKSFLPNRRELMRALRPLQRKVSNPHHLELSIEETVNLSAQLGWIQCVAMSAKMAWLELILIVDTSPSMQMWDKTIHEWLSLLQRNRAFENIRIYRMDASQATPTFKPAKPVLSPARQQAIWIVSDCISAAWHSGELFKYLKRWQKLQPLAIVQMLPFNMWKRTALGRGEECRFYPPVRAGLPTAQWRSDAPETILNLPVFTLDVDSHSAYAQLFVAARDVWSVGFVHTAATKYSTVPPVPNNELSPEEIEKRLTQFRRLASPSAQTLAAYLAAVPLTLPIMRLVQDEMWKKYHDTPPQQSHLAEVLLSGLVQRRELFGAKGYDFLAGLRPKLLDGISVYEEGVAVLRVVSEYVSTHAGSCVDFRALLENPESVEGVNTFELPPDAQHFAEVGAEVLARMGGRYQAVATQLKNLTQVGVEFIIPVRFLPGTARTFETKKAGKLETFTVYERTFYITPDVPLVMVYVPAGEFMMGSNDGHNEKPVHLVKIEQAFYMGKFPVTQEQYQAVMGETPSNFRGQANLAVESLYWKKAKEFCEKLSFLLKQEFRLPSESEWEYACRAETSTNYWWGDKMEDNRCWYGGNSGSKTHLVDENVNEHTNPFGLCDMSGNVWEWCEDNWENNYETPRTQAAYKNSNVSRLLRGGSWGRDANSCRSAYRGNNSLGNYYCGFRVVFLAVPS
jgi:formylglycine-generating enzyme required for sulfatase activity